MAGGAIAWASRRQAWVALSTCEAELNALTEGVRESEWIRGLLNELLGQSDLGQDPYRFTQVLGDNVAALKAVERDTMRRNTRHLAVRVAYISERKDTSISLTYVNSSENVADAFTKAVPVDALTVACSRMGIGIAVA